MNERSNILKNWVIIGVALLIFTYVVLRAYFLSFTHDEALSYSILQGNESLLKTANHHVLNTFLMRISSSLFGFSELALRLPNVLFFGIYLFFSYKLLKQFNNYWLIILGIALLMLNPMPLEYFALARGYGISLGCMLGSIYFLLKGLKSKESGSQLEIRNYLLTLVFAGLAMAANLSLINFYISVIILFFIKYVWTGIRKKSLSRKQHLSYWLLSFLALAPLFLALDRTFELKELNQLYFGATSLNDFLVILFMHSCEAIYHFTLLKVIVLLVLVLGVLFVVFGKSKRQSFLPVFALLAFLFIAIVLERALFDVKYPTQRTALYFIPVFGIYALFLVEGIGTLFTKRSVKVLLSSVGIITSMALVYNFIATLNLQYTYAWKYDAHTKHVVEEIVLSDELEVEASISNNWLFEPSLNYYLDQKLPELGNATHGIDSSLFIYDIVTDQGISGYSIVKKYDDISTCLYVKKRSDVILW